MSIAPLFNSKRVIKSNAISLELKNLKYVTALDNAYKFELENNIYKFLINSTLSNDTLLHLHITLIVSLASFSSI